MPHPAAAAIPPERTGRKGLPVTLAAGLLGYGHGATELVCSCTLTRVLDATDLAAGAVLWFNLLAFVSQPPVGWIVDRLGRPHRFLLLSAPLLAAGLAVSPWWPGAAIGLLGVGNCLYHVIAGASSLRLSGGTAAPLGLMVGPGAIGVSLGIGLARLPAAYAFGGCAIALLLGLGVGLVGGPAEEADKVGRADREADTRVRFAPLALLLLCVAARALAGAGLGFEWDTSAGTAIALAVGAVLGKIGGGFAADRMGWLRFCLVALGLGVPALWGGQTFAVLGWCGALLFQAPMAVTLGGIGQALPGRPALAFGLASTAVYAGTLLPSRGVAAVMHSAAGLSGVALATALLLALGLAGGRHAPAPVAGTREESH